MMPSIKANPFSIPWENQDPSGLGGLSPEKKQRLNKAVDRMNADYNYLQMYKRANGSYVPKQYYEYGKIIVDSFTNSPKFNPNTRKNTEVTIAEETFVLDREKARVYYEENIMAQIFDPVTRPLNKFKWDIRQHAIKKMENAVKFGRRFDEPRFIQLQISDQMDKGVGWYLGYQINRWDLLENEGELFDLQYETMLEAATQMARAANEHIATGSTTIIGVTDDMGEAGSGSQITGFLNNGSAQSFTVSTLTTYKNILTGLKNGLSDLKTVHATKNVILIWTAGIPDQAELNYPTYGHGNYNEWDEIQRVLVGPMKPIKQVWCSDKVIGSTPGTSTQAAALVALDPRLMSRLIVLPLQTLPSLEKNWQDDISEVMLAADILRYNVRADSNVNAFPLTLATSLTTTNLGYRSEERMA